MIVTVSLAARFKALRTFTHVLGAFCLFYALPKPILDQFIEYDS